MEYWERIKALREDRDITQKELAEFNSVFKIVDNHVVLKENEK